jgi:hypothetical protein
MSTQNWSDNDRNPHSLPEQSLNFISHVVTAVTLKQQRVLLQLGNQQSGDRQQMECEVLAESGGTVEDSSGHSDT